MEDGKRRAYIKYQATTRKKQERGVPPKGASPSTKTKLSDKTNHLPKKPKVAAGLAIREIADASKLPHPFGPGKGKGLMAGQGLVTKKCPVLLLEDPQYALKQFSSIIKGENYEDLGNHATEAIRGMGLFSLA